MVVELLVSHMLRNVKTLYECWTTWKKKTFGSSQRWCIKNHFPAILNNWFPRFFQNNVSYRKVRPNTRVNSRKRGLSCVSMYEGYPSLDPMVSRIEASFEPAFALIRVSTFIYSRSLLKNRLCTPTQKREHFLKTDTKLGPYPLRSAKLLKMGCGQPYETGILFMGRRNFLKKYAVHTSPVSVFIRACGQRLISKNLKVGYRLKI